MCFKLNIRRMLHVLYEMNNISLKRYWNFQEDNINNQISVMTNHFLMLQKTSRSFCIVYVPKVIAFGPGSGGLQNKNSLT